MKMAHKKSNQLSKKKSSQELQSLENKIPKEVNPRHLTVLKRMVGKEGKPVSMATALKESGYSDKYADNPQKVKQTKSWNTLMSIYLADEDLAKVHKELLYAKDIAKFDFPLSFSDEDIREIVEEQYGFILVKIVENTTDAPQFRSRKAYYIKPEYRARKDGLDMAFKLKNKYAPETMNLRFAGYSKEQLIDFLMSKLSKKKK